MWISSGSQLNPNLRPMITTGQPTTEGGLLKKSPGLSSDLH